MEYLVELLTMLPFLSTPLTVVRSLVDSVLFPKTIGWKPPIDRSAADNNACYSRYSNSN